MRWLLDNKHAESDPDVIAKMKIQWEKSKKSWLRQVGFMGDCVQGEGEVSPARMSVCRAVSGEQGLSCLTTHSPPTTRTLKVSPSVCLGRHLGLTGWMWFNQEHSLPPYVKQCDQILGHMTHLFHFCVLWQEPVSQHSFPVCQKERGWHEDLTSEHTMCFAEPVLGGTHGHGRELSWAEGSNSCTLCLALFGGGSVRWGWEGRGWVIPFLCWSLETFFSAGVML